MKVHFFYKGGGKLQIINIDESISMILYIYFLAKMIDRKDQPDHYTKRRFRSREDGKKMYL